MKRRSGPQLFPILITIIVVVMIIAGIVSIGRAIFSGGDSAEPEQEDTGRQLLLDAPTGSSVKVVARGPIVADEQFSSYQITASPDERAMTVYRGYLDSVRRQKTYSNNQQAYEQFTYALDKANMMKGEVPTDDTEDDVRGICATGYVYEYFVIQDGSTVKRLWTSTCDGSKGSLDASAQQLNNLFETQIPAFEDLDPFDNAFGGLKSLKF